jgi:hypothetical protein
MPSYEIRLVRTLGFWGLSRSRKPRWRRIQSRLTIRAEVQDEASWYQELDRIAQEFDLGNTWKLQATRRIEPGSSTNPGADQEPGTPGPWPGAEPGTSQ